MTRPAALAICTLALVGCAGGAGQPGGKELLAYAGSPGDSASYVARQTLRGRISLNGMPHLAVIETRAALSETVSEVRSDGSCRIGLSYMLDSLEVNGASAEIEERLRDLKFEFLRLRTGKIKEIGAAEGTAEALGLMLQSLEMFFPVFPSSPVGIGDSWKESSRMRMGETFVETESSGELLGFENLEGIRCAVIGLELSARTTGDAGKAPLQQFGLSLKGKVHFAAPGGHVVRARHRGRMDIDASRGALPVDAELMFVADFERLPGL